MITQIVKFNVKPEYYECFKAALLEDKKNAEQEEGYVEMRLFADRKQSSLICYYECWKGQDAQDYHREHPYTVKICQLVDTVLASQVEVLNLGETMPVQSKQPDSKESDGFLRQALTGNMNLGTEILGP